MLVICTFCTNTFSVTAETRKKLFLRLDRPRAIFPFSRFYCCVFVICYTSRHGWIMRLTHISHALSLAASKQLFSIFTSDKICTKQFSWQFPISCSDDDDNEVTIKSIEFNDPFVFADINKGSPIDYKSGVSGGSACSTPTKDTLKQYDRAYSGPMMPQRAMGGLFGGSATGTLGPAHHMSAGVPPPHHHHHHYSTPLNFRKGFTSKCTWKCTAILVIMLCVVLLSILVYMSGELSH